MATSAFKPNSYFLDVLLIFKYAKRIGKMFRLLEFLSIILLYRLLILTSTLGRLLFQPAAQAQILTPSQTNVCPTFFENFQQWNTNISGR